MTYDYEKYRLKREKVLGVRRRGLSFGTMATIVSLVIIMGLGGIVVPRSIAWINTRHLEDAIFKLNETQAAEASLIDSIRSHNGVKEITTDRDGTRLVITFDRTLTDADSLSFYFRQQGIHAVLLNHVDHNQRLATLEKESRF